ncbi:hypothetical protein CDAR_75211 [Caerostris darwini]|uniref:Secreted protein n=1 Tax=Caerostris darwini TaxID=1538125 RepID=A0AAV4NFZ8_9ARAC|nr:hypothetical protein CDAR_75211 [Caerostris darwini]
MSLDGHLVLCRLAVIYVIFACIPATAAQPFFSSIQFSSTPTLLPIQISNRFVYIFYKLHLRASKNINDSVVYKAAAFVLSERTLLTTLLGNVVLRNTPGLKGHGTEMKTFWRVTVALAKKIINCNRFCRNHFVRQAITWRVWEEWGVPPPPPPSSNQCVFALD